MRIVSSAKFFACKVMHYFLNNKEVQGFLAMNRCTYSTAMFLDAFRSVDAVHPIRVANQRKNDAKKAAPRKGNRLGIVFTLHELLASLQ